MAGLTLNFDVKNQIIYYGEQNQTVADSINYLRCRFTFTDDWGNKKYCVFYGAENEDKPISVPVLLEQDGGYYCTAPFEIIKPPFFKLSVYCEENDALITSSIQKVDVRPSGYSNETKEPEQVPPPKEYMYVHTKNDESGTPFIRQKDGALEYSENGVDWKAAAGSSQNGVQMQSGTWDPILEGSSVAGNPEYKERLGTWAIIGNIYKISLYMELSSLGGMQGFINIFGLPFVSPKNIMSQNANAVLRSSLTQNEYAIGIMVGWIGIQIWDNHYLSRYINNNDLNNNSIIKLSFFYLLVYNRQYI